MRSYITPLSHTQSKEVISELIFTGVFDGHGGAKVSKYIKQTLYSNFLQLMPENRDKWTDRTIYSGLKNAVKKVDFEVSRIKSWNHQGSTLAAVYINKRPKNPQTISESTESSSSECADERHQDKSQRNDSEKLDNKYSIFTINVGDSRIVLGRGKIAIDLTTDHKPNSRYERELEGSWT